MQPDLLSMIFPGEREQMGYAGRQSLVNTAMDCARKAKYGLDQPVSKSSLPREVGTAYHAGLESYYLEQQQIGRVSPPSEATLSAATAAALSSLDSAMERYGSSWLDTEEGETLEQAQVMTQAMLDQYLEDAKVWQLYEDAHVLGPETYFELELPDGRPLTGSIDLPLQLSNGGVMLIDHKTGKKKWAKNKGTTRTSAQAPIYIWAATQLWPDASSYHFAYDVMTYAGDVQHIPVDVTQNDIDRTLLNTSATLHLLETIPLEVMPGNTSSFLCSSKYCDFWDLCPFGKGK